MTPSELRAEIGELVLAYLTSEPEPEKFKLKAIHGVDALVCSIALIGKVCGFKEENLLLAIGENLRVRYPETDALVRMVVGESPPL